MGVDVLGRDGTAGLDDGLDNHELAVGLRCGCDERDLLTGGRVLDDISCMKHGLPPWCRLSGDTRMLVAGNAIGKGTGRQISVGKPTDSAERDDCETACPRLLGSG